MIIHVAILVVKRIWIFLRGYFFCYTNYFIIIDQFIGSEIHMGYASCYTQVSSLLSFASPFIVSVWVQLCDAPVWVSHKPR
jgi:hypothetical protein